ncbi:MAG: glycosyltransferase family 2 protein [Phycisphaerae bacterium]
MISVTIVNYNTGDILRRNIKPLLESSYIAEVIVVDNDSKDNSVDLMNQIAISESRVKFIKNDKNVGFARACNMAISHTGESEYLLFLNPDCGIEHDALKKLIGCLKKYPGVGMAGPLLLNPDGTEQAGGRRTVPTPWRSFVRAFGLSSKLGNRYPKLFNDFLLHKEPLPDAPIEVEAISGACMMVKRNALEEVGLLDEGYFMHCEDLDWCMRFRQKGWKIIFVPEATAIHYQGICSKGRPIFVEWHKHKGMARFYNKFFRHQYPSVLMWLVMLGIWIRFVAKSIYLSVLKIQNKLKA